MHKLHYKPGSFIIRRKLLNRLSDETLVRLDYLRCKKRLISLRNPRSFSEKMQWIKLYGGLDKFTTYVDKYEVRRYIEQIVGASYLIPLWGVWDTFEEIPFGSLPKKFVLKATHASGFNYICHDKSSLDIDVLRVAASNWLKTNYYTTFRETQYKACTPRIICEEYVEDDSGSLRDYKFFCFGGKPVVVQVDTDRYIGHKRDLFDLQWQKLPVRLEHPNAPSPTVKPSRFREMVDVAERLSRNFPFVRVDLYLVNDRVYFGELTFTPGNGFVNFTPLDLDFQLGELINLEEYTKSA